MSALAKEVIQTAPTRPVLTRAQGLKIVRRFLNELGSQCLEVVLIPSKVDEIRAQGGKIRCVQVQNPKWYQDFCALYESCRGHYQKRHDYCGGFHDSRKNNRCLRRKKRVKPYVRYRWKLDTAIKRRDTIRGLNELLSGRCESEYAKRLRDFIRRNWQKYGGG